MSTLRFELHIEMDNGITDDVVADQRDIAKFEVQAFGWPVQELETRPTMTFFRYLGWSASVRQGLTDKAWDEWNEHCVEVFPPDADETTDEDQAAPDPLESPGAKAPSAARSSRSRSRAAKA